MDVTFWQLTINIAFPLLLIMFAYFVGSMLEARHFRNIRGRELAMREFPVSTFEQMPDGWQTRDPELMVGSVVVSLDYFKRIIAGLRGLAGGRIKTYEPLLDRARREALLRLTEQARRAGFDAVINVRLETSRMANSQSGQGTAGIEMLAYGTAVRVDRR